MDKVRIKIITLGHLPIDFTKRKIENWKSEIFEICKPIENYALSADSDKDNWAYSDETLNNEIPKSFDGDFLLAIVNVRLESNWYSRRVAENRVVFTFHEVQDILRLENIPIENIIYRLLYSYSLVYKSLGYKIPQIGNTVSFTHDETRGCLFDMNGIKADVINSCFKPVICSECYEKLRSRKVSTEVLDRVRKEIGNIKKDLFYQMRDYIKVHPISALLISSLYAIFLGCIGSLIASLIFEKLKGK